MEKKVIVMRGIPGSGKTTFANKLLEENPNVYKRINRDELRKMFDAGHVSKANEKFVRKVRDILLVKALEEGKSVIVDDTNLSDKNEKRIQQLVREFNILHQESVVVEIVQMETSLKDCIDRDSKREKPVGAKQIKEMHRKFFNHTLEYSKQDENLPKAILCDLDGTLALLNGRNPFDASTCENDLPNFPVLNLVKMYFNSGFQILLVSGRMDSYRDQTIQWLEKYQVEYSHLYMRKTYDQRKDSIIKREIFDANINGKYFVEAVLDDRNQVVDMWRNELQLPCFQVYYGDF